MTGSVIPMPLVNTVWTAVSEDVIIVCTERQPGRRSSTVRRSIASLPLLAELTSVSR